MPYCTAAELRAEGVTETQASDGRLRLLIAPRVAVWFGDARVELLEVFADAAASIAHVRTPARELGAVDVVLENLDDAGAPTGERSCSPTGTGTSERSSTTRAT